MDSKKRKTTLEYTTNELTINIKMEDTSQLMNFTRHFGKERSN